MSVAEVVKGCFEFSIAGEVLTVAAKGVTKVRFPKAASPGLFVTLDLTGRSYSFDADPYPVNAGCGITTTVDWGNAMPWFVYLGNEDDTAANVFAFNTRDPRMCVTPAAGLINDTAAVGATAQSQNHINSWKADDAGIAAKPCICIGSHTMTWETDAAPVADVWELVALTTADGFGKFQEGVRFTFPVQQNSNTSSYHQWSDGGDTLPQYSTMNASYYIFRNGSVRYLLNMTGDGGTEGLGAHAIFFNAPYKSAAVGQNIRGGGYYYNSGIGLTGGVYMPQNSTIIIIYTANTGAMTCNDQNAASRECAIDITFPAFQV